MPLNPSTLEELEKFGVTEGILHKLHACGFLSVLPLSRYVHKTVREFLDSTYPDEIPDNYQRGIYRLALAVCQEPITLGHLVQPRIYVADAILHNFLRSSPQEIQLMRELNPKAYARLSKEAQTYRQENPTLPSLIEAMRPLDDATIRHIIQQIARCVRSDCLAPLSQYYLYCDESQRATARALSCNYKTVRRYVAQALTDLDIYNYPIAAVFTYDPRNTSLLPDNEDVPPPPLTNFAGIVLRDATLRRPIFQRRTLFSVQFEHNLIL